jgi:hypothetical protein
MRITECPDKQIHWISGSPNIGVPANHLRKAPVFALGFQDMVQNLCVLTAKSTLQEQEIKTFRGVSYVYRGRPSAASPNRNWGTRCRAPVSFFIPKSIHPIGERLDRRVLCADASNECVSSLATREYIRL